MKFKGASISQHCHHNGWDAMMRRLMHQKQVKDIYHFVGQFYTYLSSILQDTIWFNFNLDDFSLGLGFDGFGIMKENEKERIKGFWSKRKKLSIMFHQSSKSNHIRRMSSLFFRVSGSFFITKCLKAYYIWLQIITYSCLIQLNVNQKLH